MKRNHRTLKAWQNAVELVVEIYQNGTKELLHFLGIAGGSLSELDTLIEVAMRLGYIERPQNLSDRVDDVAGLVMGLAASLKRKL